MWFDTTNSYEMRFHAMRYFCGVVLSDNLKYNVDCFARYSLFFAADSSLTGSEKGSLEIISRMFDFGRTTSLTMTRGEYL